MEKRFRSAKSFNRSVKGTRAPYERVLIVCEGEKTEPNYFRSLKDYLRLATSNVTVTGECGSDPSSVVAKAKDEVTKTKKEKSQGSGFDKVYCVFDKDKHERYSEAIDTAKANGFIPITSIPCFEVWVLLHFMFTASPYTASKGKSICAQVINKVRSKSGFANYQKGAKTYFHDLLDKLPTASANAKKLRSQNLASGTDNPSTMIDNLIDYLFSLKLSSCRAGKSSEKTCMAAANPDDAIKACLECRFR